MSGYKHAHGEIEPKRRELVIERISKTISLKRPTQR
jgi:hypothetical protein